MWKSYQLVFVLVIINFNLNQVWSNESNEEAYPNYEYLQIFTSMPALFEYLLNAVEEKPEILEKNDISMFKRNIDEGKNKKRASDRQNSDCEREEERNRRDDEFKDSPSTIAYEYGNSIVMNELDATNCKIETKRAVDNDNLLTNNIKDEIAKRDIKKNDDFPKASVWTNDNGYPGFQSFFSLDVRPEDIQDSSVMAEKLLEDYNASRMHKASK